MQVAAYGCARAAWRRLSHEFVGAIVVVFLLFGPYLASTLTGRKAAWLAWQPHDPFVLLGSFAGLAVLCVAARETVRRLAGGFLLRCFDHLFVIGLGAGVLTNVWFHTLRPQGYHIGQFGVEMRTAWLAMFAIVGYSLARPGSRLVLRCRQTCQVLGLVVIIITVQVLRLPTLAQAMDPLPGGAVEPARSVRDHPVYVLIFDEWSYPRSYDAGRLRPMLPNLEALSARATTYHAARAPGIDTGRSIPAMCRSTEDPPRLHGLQPCFLKDGTLVPAADYASIITTAGCAHYRKIMVHFGYALALWLGDELDVARSYPWYPRGEHALAHAALQVHQATSYWTDPWSSFLYGKLQTRVNDSQVLKLHEGIHRDLLTILRDEPARTFAIVHYPLPHPPYILDPDGSYRGPSPQAWDRSSVEQGYERNLRVMDRVIGEIVRTLEDAGRFDDALLIVTSDHSWRDDPAVPEPGDDLLRHVPLIVKAPGQTEARSVSETFGTHRLGELIGRALQREVTVSRLPPGKRASPIPSGTGLPVWDRFPNLLWDQILNPVWDRLPAGQWPGCQHAL